MNLMLVVPAVALTILGSGVKDIVDVAVGSPDHTTLVKLVQAADYVVSLKNPGPLTVFAPTNAAFGKLPADVIADLQRPEKKDALREILKYHVTPSVYEVKWLKDGQTLGQANGAKISIAVKDGVVTVNGAKILASVRASNGIVHVIDGVLLPPPAK